MNTDVARSARCYVCAAMLVRARSLLTRSDPVRVDELVGLALALGIELQVWLGPDVHHRVAAALAGGVLGAAVAVRRRWPLGVLPVVVLALTVQDVVGGRVTEHALGAIPALILVFYGAGAFLSERRARLALGIGLVGGSLDVLITTATFSDLFFTTIMLVLVPWSVGRVLRERRAREHAHRERGELLDSERERRVVLAAFGERARIARELHDVIAHSVSVMVIQAGGARMVMGAEPERAEESLRSVERAGREALAEMRRLSGRARRRRGSAGARAAAGARGHRRTLIAARARCRPRDRRARRGSTPATRLAGARSVRVPDRSGGADQRDQARRHRRAPRSGCAGQHDALELEVSDDGRGPRAVNGRPAAGTASSGCASARPCTAAASTPVPALGGGFAVRARLPLAADQRPDERAARPCGRARP